MYRVWRMIVTDEIEELTHEWKRKQISVGRTVYVQSSDGGCKSREWNPDASGAEREEDCSAGYYKSRGSFSS